MHDKKLVKILRDITLLLETKGENPFKARAYSNAADKIEKDGIDVREHVANGTLDDIKGFGKALVEKITDYVQNGTMSYYEKLKEEVPSGLIALSMVRGLGAKKAQELYQHHGIQSVDDLKKAFGEGKLAGVKGFGEKGLEQLGKSLEMMEASKGRIRLDTAYKAARTLLDRIRGSGIAVKAIVTGELARWCETVGKIEIVVSTAKADELIEHLSSFYEIESDGNSRRLKLKNSVTLHCYFCAAEEAFWQAHALSGSEAFREAFFEFLKYKGYDADTASLRRNGKAIHFNSEKDIYEEAGLQYITPELREEQQTLQFAAQGQIPELVVESDMRGMVHNHSTWSDGSYSIKEMALAAKELGFEYFVICDHSRTAAYANGLSIERVMEQHREIDELNAEGIGIPVFKGIESDILPDGNLDYPDEVLALFDLVVASVHSSFRLSREQQTERIIKAVANPYTTILGHPTGRLLLRREGYEVDMKAVIDAAAEHDAVIEINANPNRLDMDWRWAQYAKQKRVRMAVNPDAHRTFELAYVMYGVHIARKGWVEKSDIINTYDLEKFKKEVLWKGKRRLTS